MEFSDILGIASGVVLAIGSGYIGYTRGTANALTVKRSRIEVWQLIVESNVDKMIIAKQLDNAQRQKAIEYMMDIIHQIEVIRSGVIFKTPLYELDNVGSRATAAISEWNRNEALLQLRHFLRKTTEVWQMRLILRVFPGAWCNLKFSNNTEYRELQSQIRSANIIQIMQTTSDTVQFAYEMRTSYSNQQLVEIGYATAEFVLRKNGTLKESYMYASGLNDLQSKEIFYHLDSNDKEIRRAVDAAKLSLSCQIEKFLLNNQINCSKQGKESEKNSLDLTISSESNAYNNP